MRYTKDIPVFGFYDIVVCGGGFSGFAAAFAAAREGKRVILIEKGSCLGGVGTQAMVNHILGQRIWQNGKIMTCVGGIYDHLERRLVSEGNAVDINQVDMSCPPYGWFPGLAIGLIFNGEAMKSLLEQMLTEMAVNILYLTDIVDVLLENNSVTGILVHNKSGLQVIKGLQFVDATGDGDICAMSGCHFDYGDEEHGTASASLEMHVENVDHQALTDYMRQTRDVRFRALIEPLQQAGKWPFPYNIFISVMMTQKDVFMINTIRQVGIDGTNGQSLTQGIIDGRKENLQLFSVMKEHFPGFQNARIRQIAPMIGIRETRRIHGEYTLTVEDLITGRDFTDGIAVSGYGWDLPHPKHPSLQPFHGIARQSPYTQIPYRCLVPKGINNLIMAGRCISTEREVMGPVRVMGPCLAMGECAGLASAIAIELQIPFRDVPINTLQEKIHSYGGITNRSQIRPFSSTCTQS